MSTNLDKLRELAAKLDPKGLFYGTMGPDEQLDYDLIGEIENTVDDMRISLEDPPAEVTDLADAISAALHAKQVVALAEFDLKSYEQEEWEKRNPSEEEKVAAASAAANQAATDQLDFLVHAAEDALNEALVKIEAYCKAVASCG